MAIEVMAVSNDQTLMAIEVIAASNDVTLMAINIDHVDHVYFCKKIFMFYDIQS